MIVGLPVLRLSSEPKNVKGEEVKYGHKYCLDSPIQKSPGKIAAGGAQDYLYRWEIMAGELLDSASVFLYDDGVPDKFKKEGFRCIHGESF
jgi:hypothetical protein